MSESTSSSHRCLTCKSSSENARNLAVFIDGTSNEPGDKKTNVVKLYNIISDGKGPQLRQRAYYLEGIGVYDVDNSSLRKSIYSKLEMAFARNVEKNVMEAYSWLTKSYREGDQIYLFGFSRGAYQVRALASMIHEVGLVKEAQEKRIQQAYRHYRSIDPNDPETRSTATQFKRNFCWPGVRVHFVGVWDTVSSLGLVKEDVHITASASVTNACHFRHALALDERRVKFIPEYFLEMNAHFVKIASPRTPVSDVKEIWFAGYHSDVGGTSRPAAEGVPNLVVDEHNPVHAGNVPLQWMRQEAEAKGLVFKSEAFAWYPEDVDFGREDTMNPWWKLLEYLRIRHQVSFSGTGNHERRRHLSRPRLVIPGQPIHFSVLPGDVYTPQATLAHGVDIPTVPHNASGGIPMAEPWISELADEGTTTRLTSLLSDQQKSLKSLGELLHILNFRLNSRQGRTIPSPQWPEISIREQSGFNKFALTVIYDVTSNFTTSQELVRDARDFLDTILPFPDHLDFFRVLYILRFSARHPELRRRFVAHDEVTKALTLALDWIPKSSSKNLLPLIMDSLHCLIDDKGQRGNVIDRLSAGLDGTEARQTRLSLALEMKVPAHLIASLRMAASLAQYRPDLCEGLKAKLFKLAQKERGPVGSAAVEVLVALNVPLTHDVLHFSNVLGYLGNILPRLDAEVGSTSASHETVVLPPVLVNGSGKLNEEVMDKLVQTIDLRDVHECTVATLTLLKLCNYSDVRNFCSRSKVLDIFMKQLGRKETSLLAAYALKTCLGHDMWTPDDFSRAAPLIVTMFDEGGFDDAVGRVEGFKIFGEFMASGNLRRRVIELGMMGNLIKKLEGGERHQVRMSLICLEILGRENPEELERVVVESVALLRDKSIRTQKRGIKTLSSLAQTEAGEEAIQPHVIEIVKMLLEGSPPPRYQLFGPTAALYELCRNETLRMHIHGLPEFQEFKSRRGNPTLYPQTRKK